MHRQRTASVTVVRVRTTGTRLLHGGPTTVGARPSPPFRNFGNAEVLMETLIDGTTGITRTAKTVEARGPTKVFKGRACATRILPVLFARGNRGRINSNRYRFCPLLAIN